MITIEPPSTPSIPAPSKPALTRFLARAKTAVGLSGDVAVLLTSDAALKALNKNFRGKNKPTDVLSFPTPPEVAAQYAGDLAISLDTAARQAATYGHSLEVEVKVLLLHGLLHLDGEDHETDQGQMAAREAELRTQLKLPVSLIDRVSKPASSRPKPASISSKPASPRPERVSTPASSRPERSAVERSLYLAQGTPKAKSENTPKPQPSKSSKAAR